MKNNTDLINKALSKTMFNYIINLYTPSTNWFDFSKYVYDVDINYTELKLDFTPSTATAKISFYMPKESALCNLIIQAINNKTLKCRIYLDSNPTELMFEGYIDYPTFNQKYEGFSENKASIEFFDYTYILKSKKIGRVNIHSGTARGGSSNTITLATSASSTSGYYNYNMIEITNGKGITQERVIISYNGSTKVATVDRNWDVIPDTTSVYVIKKKLKYVNQKKCDNSDTKNSLVHLIMEQAGFDSSYIQVNNITNIVPFIAFEEEVSCFDALKNLFQTELMIFDFYTGKLRAKSIDASTINPVMALNNTASRPAQIYGISENITTNKNNYKSIRATFDSIIVDTTTRLLFALQEKDSGYESSQIGRMYSCYKYFAGGQYFPSDGNLITATLKFNDTCDVIYADDINVQIKTYESINNRPARIILSDFQIDGGEVKFRLYNNTTYGDYLLELKIFGKPVYIQSSETIAEGDTTEGDSIKIEKNWFFTDITQLRRLINFYNYILLNIAKNKYQLEFNFLPQLEIGDIVAFTLKSGYSFNGLITGIEHKLKIDDTQTTEITAIPVAQWSYNPSNQKTIKYESFSPSYVAVASLNSLTEQIIENTLTNITQPSGTTLGGFTNTPTAPTFISIVADGWSITLSWDKQQNLANLDYYQLQVSKDQSTWTDFDGNVGGYTIEYQETTTFRGEFTNTDPPVGIGYYFRVRRKLKDGVVSPWSNTALATTVPLGSNSSTNNGLIYIDSSNFWDFIHKKFRIGSTNKYIYFDGDNIYFKSVDIELTTADLITYNSDKTKRLIHTGLSLKAQGGTSFGTTYGGVWYDEANNVMVVQADNIYQGSNKVIYQNSNSEVEVDTNKLIAYKELVIGTDGQYGNWITNTTPILRQRDTSATEYYYLVINTKIIAPNYTGGTNTMFDIVLKTYCIGYGGSNWYNGQQMQVRFTGYIYYSGSTYTIYKFRAHILGSNHYNIYAGAYIDNTNGYLHLFLYSPNQYFSAYHRYTEVYLNNYYCAKKSFIDGWDISYTDSITGYDTNFGIMYAKCGGEVMSYISNDYGILLATISIPANSDTTKFFTLYRDSIIKCIPQSSYVDIEVYASNFSLMICSYSTSKKDLTEFLPAGRYKIYTKNRYSSASFNTTIFANNIRGYGPSQIWSASDIISSLEDSW